MSRFWEQLAAASGTLFVVLTAGGVLLETRMPSLDAPAEDWTAAVRTMLFGADHLQRLGLLFLLPFWAILARRVRLAGPDHAWLGALTLAAGSASTMLFLAARAPLDVVQHAGACMGDYDAAVCGAPPANDPALYALFANLTFSFVTLALAPLAVALAALAVASYRANVFPKWLAAFTTLAAVLVAVASVLESPTYLVLPVFLFWAVAASAFLVEEKGAPPPALAKNGKKKETRAATPRAARG